MPDETFTDEQVRAVLREAVDSGVSIEWYTDCLARMVLRERAERAKLMEVCRALVTFQDDGSPLFYTDALALARIALARIEEVRRVP